MTIFVYRRQDTGHLSHLSSRLRRSIGGFARKWNWVKIGITNDPEQRANQHFKNDPEWSELVVLWKTASRRRIEDAERLLIDWKWNDERLVNLRTGGGGRKSGGPFYLYILLA